MSNAFKNGGLALTAVSQTLYTTPAATESVIHAVFLTNISEAYEGLVTITVTDASAGTDYPILYRAPVKPGSTLVFDKPVNLEAGDSLKALASSTDLMSAFLSILEVT
jgi:hypothetical protein